MPLDAPTERTGRFRSGPPESYKDIITSCWSNLTPAIQKKVIELAITEVHDRAGYYELLDECRYGKTCWRCSK